MTVIKERVLSGTFSLDSIAHIILVFSREAFAHFSLWKRFSLSLLAGLPACLEFLFVNCPSFGSKSSELLELKMGNLHFCGLGCMNVETRGFSL